jgi:hypothetical protein
MIACEASMLPGSADRARLDTVELAFVALRS